MKRHSFGALSMYPYYHPTEYLIARREVDFTEIMKKKLTNAIWYDCCRRCQCEWSIFETNYICPQCRIIVPSVTDYRNIGVKFEKVDDLKYFKGVLYWLLFSEVERMSDPKCIIMDMKKLDENQFIRFVPDISDYNGNVFEDLALFAARVLISSKNYRWILGAYSDWVYNFNPKILTDSIFPYSVCQKDAIIDTTEDVTYLPTDFFMCDEIMEILIEIMGIPIVLC